MSNKTKNLPVGQPEVDLSDESKWVPKKAGGYNHSVFGTPVSGAGKEINMKAKVTSNEGSDYHDPGRSSSGLHGNFSQKDASMAYLQNRGKEGIKIRSYQGNTVHSDHTTNNMGVTAYNNQPIPEVYKPATSHDIPSPKAVRYTAIHKDPTPRKQNTDAESGIADL